MRGICVRGRARDGRAWDRKQPSISAIGRGVVVIDKLPWPPAETQPELQHVECRIDVTPFRQLVAPCGIELRPAQLLGVFRRKRRRRPMALFGHSSRRRVGVHWVRSCRGGTG